MSRDKLIEELREKMINPYDYHWIANFILSREQRILAPLREIKKINFDTNVEELEKAINEALAAGESLDRSEG